jgi:hypothetical protein
MQMALDALYVATTPLARDRQEVLRAQQALRDRLAQPEPEPVAWHEPGAYGNVTTHKDWALANGWEPLYAAPPKREWVGLTYEEIMEMTCHEGLIRYFEAKLKEKNT